MKRALFWICALVLWAGCKEKEPPETPHEPMLPTPILPDEPTEPTAQPRGEEPAAANDEPAEDTTAAKTGDVPTKPTEGLPAPKGEPKPAPKTPPKAEAPDTAKKSTGSEPKPTPAVEPKAEAKPQPEAKPKAEAPAKQPEPAKANRTRIPNTKHVAVIVTEEMQARLDSDSRMQGWIDKVMGVANQCYAQVREQQADAGGTIVVRVTMHENSRPTPDITQLPPALSNLVACATGRLFSVRMPLFTGPEGEKHVVKLRFTP